VPLIVSAKQGILSQVWHKIGHSLLSRNKSEAANLLKRSGEPGRTRTYNPLLKRQLLYH
jgi:hypothetical protein